MFVPLQPTKYYVKSGKHQVLLLAKSPRSAAVTGMCRFHGRANFKPSKLVTVSQLGFDFGDDYSNPMHRHDASYGTDDIIESVERTKKKNS